VVISRGTGSSNPSPSSGESIANLTALIFDIVNEWVPADAFAAEPARIGNVRPRLRDPRESVRNPCIFSWVFPTRYFPGLCAGASLKRIDTGHSE
jgi:hypothetical protein